MKRVLQQFIGVIALLLVPVSLWFGLNHQGTPLSPSVALWAPFVVLAADALLVAFALGLWRVTAWERLGIAIILPLLIAMISWALMMGSVEERIAQAPAASAAHVPAGKP